MDYNNNIYEKDGKRKNLSCNNNLRYNQQKFNQNLFKDGNYTALKKNNMTSKSYSKTLLNNDFNNSNLDINNYNDFTHNINALHSVLSVFSSHSSVRHMVRKLLTRRRTTHVLS